MKFPLDDGKSIHKPGLTNFDDFCLHLQNIILESSEVREPISLDSILWEIDLENTANHTFKKSCRNSIQGKELIVDERG